MGVRSENGGDPPVGVPPEGNFFACGFAVNIDDYIFAVDFLEHPVKTEERAFKSKVKKILWNYIPDKRRKIT